MTQPDFTLDARLEMDCLVVGDWPLCRILRMNDRGFPWLILVPRMPALREIIDLDEAGQIQLLGEIARASRILRDRLRPAKLNVAALGNAVPQLHVHVIARFVTDAAWPRPVWGVNPPEAFDTEGANAEVAGWRSAFGLDVQPSP